MPSVSRAAIVFAVAISTIGPLSLAPAQQKVDTRRAVTPDASIRLGGALGSLRIIGWDRDSVALTGVIAKGARFEGAFGGNGGEPARAIKMFVEGAQDGVGTTKLELHVPMRARIWAKGGSAEIDASGVSGGLDLNIVGGSVTVHGDPRKLIIESMDGNVTIDGTP